MYYLLVFTLFWSGCSGQNPTPLDYSKSTKSNAASATDLAKSAGNDKFSASNDYQVFNRIRISDKTAFAEPVEAFSLLIPQKWTAGGEVLWNPPGSSCAGTNRYFNASSPDGRYSFKILPNYTFSYASDPYLIQVMQQVSGGTCGVGEPMDAANYVLQILRPQLENFEILESNPNPEAVAKLLAGESESRREMSNYGVNNLQYHASAVNTKVRWPDGSLGWIMCSVLTMENSSANYYTGQVDKIYTSTAANQVVFKFPEREAEKAEKLLAVIMGSIRTNQAWKQSVGEFWVAARQNSHQQHLGQMRMSAERHRQSMATIRQMGEASLARGQQRMDEMDSQMRQWEARQQSSDRIHSSFIKSIREVENYRDPSGTYELQSGYSQAWSGSDGNTFILSNDPNFNPGTVFQDQNWQQMQKVE